MQSNLKNTTQESLSGLNSQIDFNRHNFATSAEKGRQLDIEKLKKMFEWSLDTVIKGGEKIGRKPPKINDEEKKALSDDLEDILKHVNQYRQ